MPAGTTPRELAKSIRTRRTRTTRALKSLFSNPGQLVGDPDFPRLDADNALDAVDGQLPPWAQDRLPGLSAIELAHIGAWPDPDKENVRQALVKAIRTPLPVKFFWELHTGPGAEVTVIEDPDTTGGITITFRSPERNVRGGDVTVDVG